MPITVTPNIGKPGSTVTVQGSGYEQRADRWLLVYFWNPSVGASPLPIPTYNGPSFTAYYTVPNWPDGAYTIRAYDGWKGILLDEIPFTVGVAPPPETLWEKALSLGCTSTPLILVCGMVVRDQVRI